MASNEKATEPRYAGNPFVQHLIDGNQGAIITALMMADRIEREGLPVSAPEALRMLARSLEYGMAQALSERTEP